MKLLRRLVLTLIVLVVVAAIVAATLPASLAYRFIADRMGVVRLQGISGTLWRGHADVVQAFGQNVGAVDWHVDVEPLLNRRVRAHLNLNGSQLKASGMLERHADGTIEVREANFAMPASMLAPALDIPALSLLGDIDGTIAHARLQTAWVDQASGNATWHNAAVAGAAQAQLGDIKATFASTDDDVIGGTIHDMGGPLRIAGTFTVDAGKFDADATLAARDGNPQIVDALRYIGQPQADGSSHLIIHGQLFKLF
ncbi:MAG: type II secretion system protein N [Rudaea sp.]